jgi:hypothetical protein
MSDLTQHRYLPTILRDAAQYRMLRDIVRQDPNVGPGTLDLLRECFRATDRDEARGLRGVPRRA